MDSGPMSVDSSAMDAPAPSKSTADEPKYGGHSRFELELELVQSLANPLYLNYLASRKFLTNPAFVAYLDYLQYWTRPPYLKYLTHPTASLKMLQLLQQEKFRQDIMSPDLAQAMMVEGVRAAVEWHREA
ncbi:SOH1-domain-containing protein [Chaetomium strumarium]|uniref:Mediator of RNA polymerase II transcription subunit 31 n=1 Tax=Chaetomium strumarium TaxID=1170767 RepID=A0AAJ0H3S4_9PEZI|nr:SOH1-domain-containing protein [Chaetomium strumarium]